MIWKQTFTVEGLNQFSADTLLDTIGIEFTGSGDDYLVARMPVDKRTFQPFRLLHGGASVALAESLGSTASMLCLEDIEAYQAVGLEINANHLKSARGGFVIGTARPVRLGRRIHVWNIEIRDELDSLICVSRLTMAIIQKSA